MFGDINWTSSEIVVGQLTSSSIGGLFEHTRTQVDVIEFRAIEHDGLLQERFGGAIARFDQPIDLPRRARS